MSLRRYADVSRILRISSSDLAKRPTDWLEGALEALRGELDRRRAEYGRYPSMADGEVRSVMRGNARMLSSLSRYTERKRNALLGWLYYYMRRGNAIERAVERYRIRPLRREGKTEEIIRILSRMHRWNKRPSRKVARYVHDILIESRYADRWREYGRRIRETAKSLPPLSHENMQKTILDLVELKSREERSIRASVNVLARVLPERYPTWAPRFHAYRREILDNIRRLKEILRRYVALERTIRRIEEKIREIEELIKVTFEIIRTGISFYYIITGEHGSPTGVMQASFIVDAMYSPRTGIVYVHPLTLRELEACKLFFVYSWYGNFFGRSMVPTDVEGFFVPEGVTFGKDNTAERVDRPHGAVCIEIRRMEIKHGDRRWTPIRYRRVPLRKLKPSEKERGLTVRDVLGPAEEEILRKAQTTLTDFINEYKNRPERDLTSTFYPEDATVIEGAGEIWRLEVQWRGSKVSNRGNRFGGGGFIAQLPEEEQRRLGVTFELTDEGALVYKPTPEEEEKMIEDRRRRPEEWKE